MTSKAMELLFWQLLNCETEEEVHKIVQTNSLLANPDNWFPYGGKTRGDRGNFGTFENQQANPIAALVEKITNSIDALLLKRCLEEGINPESADAPRSMGEAVANFYGIKNGDFSEVSNSKRREIAADVQIIVSGDKKTPSVLIFDDGEGQHPDNFRTTFLSLHRNNKTKIPFVQGKYNMGSTGAVVFCGEYRYQLVASRRALSLVKNSGLNPYGFTLVRRHPLTQDQEEIYRSSWYEYFVINDRMPQFESNGLDIGLIENKLFKSGAIVKMYSYELPRGYTSEATLDLWRGLNQFLYAPALPCLISDTRFSRSKKHESKVMLGNRTRIVIDSKDKKEQTLSLEIESIEMGKVAIEATVFKTSVEHKEFIDRKPIIFTVNGQVHGVEDRTFISQKLGFSFLKDHLLVQVDCTNMRTTFRQDLFMANRTTLKESPALEHLLDRLAKVLKSNDALRKLNERRRQGLIRSGEDDNEILKSMIRSFPIDRTLMDLLRKNKGLIVDLPQPGGDGTRSRNGGNEKEIPKPKNRYPALFQLTNVKSEGGKKVKAIPLNGTGTIEFATDVEDEYLLRANDPGDFQLQVLDDESNDVTGGTAPGKPKKVSEWFDVVRAVPTDGTIKVSLRPRDNVPVGSEVKLEARLTAPGNDLQAIFHVRIANKKEPETEKVAVEPESPSLPRPVKVFESTTDSDEASWAEWGMDIKDVVSVKSGGTDNQLLVDAIGINMDSSVLRRYLSKNRVKSPEAVNEVREKYFTSMYFHALFLFSILEKVRLSEESPLPSDADSETLVQIVMQHYGAFLLYNTLNPALLPND